MWIMNKNGFVSIVNHDSDPELMRVRARRREAIENQFSVVGDVIDFGPDANDYRWHADVLWTDVADGLRDQVKSLDYSTNAKGNMSGDDERYHTALLECWRALRRLQR